MGILAKHGSAGATKDSESETKAAAAERGTSRYLLKHREWIKNKHKHLTNIFVAGCVHLAQLDWVGETVDWVGGTVDLIYTRGLLAS